MGTTQATPPAAEVTRINVEAEGRVYRNPKPHLYARHAMFPSLVALTSDEWLVSMEIGSAFEAADVRPFLCRSLDAGRSWSDPEPMFETPRWLATPVSTSCRISRMPDGELLGWVCFFDRSRTDEGLANAPTGGFVSTRFGVTHSRDEGRTWSVPEPVTLPTAWGQFEICSPITPTSHIRRLVPTSPWPRWEGERPPHPPGMAFASDDGGATWSSWVDVFGSQPQGVTAWEQKYVTLSDGRLLAVCWTADEVTGAARPNRYALSSDSGRTFTVPADTAIQGGTCTPVALPGNRVLCCYRGGARPGLWAHLARIDGDTWIPLADELAWGGVTSNQGASTSAPVLAQMSTLRLGYPSGGMLGDGTVLFAFWCEEEGILGIRWVRLSVRIDAG